MAKKKGFFKNINLKDKYRLGIYNDTSYEPVWHFSLRGKGVVVFLVTSIVALITGTIILVAFTPLRKFVPGYPNAETRRVIQQNALLYDSLKREVETWNLFIENTSRIVKGENPITVASQPDSSLVNYSIKDTRSKEDSILRRTVEEEEQFNLTLDTKKSSSKLSDILFFPPVKGEISNHFNAKTHLGIDIVTNPNEVVSAVLEGTVIMSEWTVETGNVIQIQHNDIISVYKHNAKLLKSQGARVKAGEAIAIVGNSGQLSTGAHLHFELWYKGIPINPEQYIVF